MSVTTDLTPVTTVVIVGAVITALVAIVRGAPVLWRAFRGFVAWADAQPEIAKIVNADVPKALSELKKGQHRAIEEATKANRMAFETKKRATEAVEVAKQTHNELMAHMEREGDEIDAIAKMTRATAERVNDVHDTLDRHIEDNAAFEDRLASKVLPILAKLPLDEDP